MFSEFDTENSADVANDLTSDVEEHIDASDEVDDMLDTLSLDELYELRNNLTGGEMPDTSDLKPIDEPNFAFRWNGEPTHNTDLDEDTEPSPRIKKLTR